MIDVSKVARLFGDRVLVRRLAKPTKSRGLYIPESHAAQKKSVKNIWWVQVVAFGLDSRAAEEHGLSVGDIVGMEPAGNHYAEFEGSDKETYLWVPEEHLALADSGSLREWQDGTLDAKSEPRVRTLGSRVLMRPDPEEEKRNGIILAADTDRKAKTGTVLQVGPGDLDYEGNVRDWEHPDSGDSVLVSADAMEMVDIFDPPLAVLRVQDGVIATTVKEVAHVRS